MSKPKKLLIVILILGITVGFWMLARHGSVVFCSSGKNLPTPNYTDPVVPAVALSYLTYGCEGCETLSGTVDSLLNENEMGILSENFGISRTDAEKPATAKVNSAEFIRNSVGNFRFLCAESDKKSSFFGVAFCDDTAKCVWISYSGAVSVKDVSACLGLAIAPGLSQQEKLAFAFYETVFGCDEVQNQGYSIMLTGHSLGGALSAMISRMSGCTAVTINGADALALDKINGIVGNTPESYEITNYLTDPKGSKFSFLKLVQNLMFLGSGKHLNNIVLPQNDFTDDPHCALSFLSQDADGKLYYSEKGVSEHE